MKKMILSAAAFAVVALSSMAVAPTTSEATPGFARQTGAACLSCHFQAIPRLAAMGRSFKIGGFRDMGEQALLEDDHLSLPAVFNAALLFKARINFTNQANGGFGGLDSSGIQWPDEAALLIGGRYGEHVGGLTEWNGGPLSYKVGYYIDLDAGTLAFVGGSTDALGTGYLFNDPSNTITRNLRGSQFRPTFFKKTSMQTGISGLGVYFSNDMIYAAVGQFVANGGVNPNGGNGGTDITGAALDFLTWARLALMTELAGMDAVVGIYSVSGSQNRNAAVGIAKETTTGVDLQLQGDLGDMSVGLYGVYQFTGKRWATLGAVPTNYTGFQLNGNLAFGHLGVKAGFSSSKNKTGVGAAGAAVKTAFVGGWYSLAQNVELDVEYESTSGGGKKQTTILLEYVY